MRFSKGAHRRFRIAGAYCGPGAARGRPGCALDPDGRRRPRQEIAPAALEAVGYQTRDLLAAMGAEAGFALSRLRVDGGMAASDWTMQFLADILPAAIERPPLVETTAWGAAYVAGLMQGLYPEPEAMLARWSPERRFAPQMPEEERGERYAGWRRAVAGVLAQVPS